MWKEIAATVFVLAFFILWIHNSGVQQEKLDQFCGSQGMEGDYGALLPNYCHKTEGSQYIRIQVVERDGNYYFWRK